MTLHANAKTTLKTRRLMIDRIERQAWTYAQAAAASSVSVRTVAKWVARARRAAPLTDTSSRPIRQPRATDATRVEAILALRRQRWTSWAIARQLGMPRSTVAVIVRRHGLGRLAPVEPAPIIQRYEWPHAGDLLHLDIKPLGRFRAMGSRFLGARRHVQTRGHGYEFVHVAVDDATRLAYVEIRRTTCAIDCSRFLARAVRWFGRRGIHIRRILTDNGAGYISLAFRKRCRLEQLQHKRTRPYTPRTNGKAERFIQTLMREWAYRQPYTSSAERGRQLGPYVAFYNRRRPHMSLAGRTPWTRFQEAA
jgi:transposase InsO family protein